MFTTILTPTSLLSETEVINQIENIPIRTIVFDIDETLYSYRPNHIIAQRMVDDYCVREFDWPAGEMIRCWMIVYKEVEAKLGFDNAAIHDILLRIQIILEQHGINPLPHARLLYHMYWDEIMKHIKPESGVRNFLLSAREHGIRLGLGTDMMTDIQYQKLEVLGLIDCFDFIVTSEEAGYEKPTDGFFHTVLQKANCHPEECLMIGDNWNKDIVGALNNHMQAAWYRPDANLETILPEQKEILFQSYDGIRFIC